jgi:hypothetical protein
MSAAISYIPAPMGTSSSRAGTISDHREDREDMYEMEYKTPVKIIVLRLAVFASIFIAAAVLGALAYETGHATVSLKRSDANFRLHSIPIIQHRRPND